MSDGLVKELLESLDVPDEDRDGNLVE